MEILFNKQGAPLIMNSTIAFMDTYADADFVNAYKEKNALFPKDNWRQRYVYVDDKKVVAWGKGNRFPQMAAKMISETTVLNTGLRFLWKLILGQGVYACKVTGYDAKGNEELAPIDNKDIQSFLNGRMCRKYMEKVLRDYVKFGNGATQFVPDANGNIMGLNPLNALWYRYTEADDNGNREAIISGDWPINRGNYNVLPVLNDYDPELMADSFKFTGSAKKGFVYSVKDSFSNEDCYGEPRWWPAFISGWIDIAHLVPKYLAKAYKNQTTWKWHVQIPYSYWDKKFPVKSFKNIEERKQAINSYMDSIESNLLGAENAEKPIFTNYTVNEMNGRVEEEWKITPLANKYDSNNNLVTSAGANAEILFSLAINPAIFGSMPGGSYSQNLGGSNIREAFLVNIANAWIERQNILDPLNLFLKMKFNITEEVQLRFRNTILTTLDTGAGTQKTLS